MADGAWAEVWREPDGHWRWRYEERGDDGLPRVELPSAEHYPNRRAAAEAARTAYPGIQVRRRYPGGQGPPSRQRARGRAGGPGGMPDRDLDDDLDSDLDDLDEDRRDGHHGGRRRARHRQGRGASSRQGTRRGGRGRGASGPAGGFKRGAARLSRLAAFVLAAALLSKLFSAWLRRGCRPRRRRETRDPDRG